jgi:uncharacterized RDD family membrane protein YckC
MCGEVINRPSASPLPAPSTGSAHRPAPRATGIPPTPRPTTNHPVRQQGLAGAENAGFWLRLVAAIIDSVILVIIMVLPAFYLGSQIRMGSSENVGSHLVLWQFAGTIIPFLYFTLLESSALQATPGKMALGLKVTDLDGNQISFVRAVGRQLGKIVSGLILNIGYIMAGFTEEKQALHDMIAGTLVVRS